LKFHTNHPFQIILLAEFPARGILPLSAFFNSMNVI
jgi:hypothetical protein